MWDLKHNSSIQIAQRAAAYTTDFLDNLDLRRAAPHAQSNKWKPPPSHLYKINIAIEKKKNEPTGGIIIRDGEGETIAACCTKFQNQGNKVQLMAEAALLALSFAADLSLYDIMLGGDCADIFLALQNPKKCLYPFGNKFLVLQIFYVIKQLM